MFYKMTRNGNSLFINSKKSFDNKLKVNEEYVKKVFEFAYSMTFGNDGEHRNYRSGGTHRRRNSEIFCDTFQGKLSEYAIYQFFENKFYIEEPDVSCFKLGIWDQFDFKINDKIISVKSTKHFGNLLLLETKDWTVNGEYKPNENEPIDYTFLVRVKDEVVSMLKSKRMYYCDYIDKDELWNMIKGLDFSFDIPGYITKEDLIYLINNKFIIKQGEMLNGSTRMDAENYYCQVGNLRNVEMFMEE